MANREEYEYGEGRRTRTGRLAKLFALKQRVANIELDQSSVVDDIQKELKVIEQKYENARIHVKYFEQKLDADRDLSQNKILNVQEELEKLKTRHMDSIHFIEDLQKENKKTLKIVFDKDIEIESLLETSERKTQKFQKEIEEINLKHEQEIYIMKKMNPKMKNK